MALEHILNIQNDGNTISFDSLLYFFILFVFHFCHLDESNVLRDGSHILAVNFATTTTTTIAIPKIICIKKAHESISLDFRVMGQHCSRHALTIVYSRKIHSCTLSTLLFYQCFCHCCHAKKKKREKVHHTLPRNVDKDSWLARLASQMGEIEKRRKKKRIGGNEWKYIILCKSILP